jgi:hypothetical protein
MERKTKKLQDQVAKTAQVLRCNIDVAGGGHSKAILVFTLVTIVFLPLSFVASLFGINTADVRNLEKHPVTVLAVALPLTVIIRGISLLVAYGGTQMEERFDDFCEGMRQGKSKIVREKPISVPNPRKRDEEEVGGMRRELLSAPDTLKRRKTAENTFIMPTKPKKRPSDRKPRVGVEPGDSSRARAYRHNPAVP